MLKTLVLLTIFIINITAYKPTSPHQQDDGRLLQQSSYQSLRIHTDFNHIDKFDTNLRDYIKNQLVPSAVSYYQAALKVIRQPGNLTVAADCKGLASPEDLVTVGADADFILVVTVNKFEDNFISKGVVCGIDSAHNRPTYGVLMFNLDFLSTYPEITQQNMLNSVLHEMTHMLGFSSELYNYYINPETNETLTNHIRNKNVNGLDITYIDVEPLTTKLRTYFKCDTLEGAYLENQENKNLSSHFERRIFMNEFMTAGWISDPVISEFTLALLEGTGWYQANYDMAERFHWGEGKGCSFLDGPCVDENTNPNFEEFCGPLGSSGCTYTGRAAAICGQTPSTFSTDASLPDSWDYFGDKISVLDYFSDNCPYFYTDPDLDCENPENAAYAYIVEEVFGPISRCFSGNISAMTPSPFNSSFCFPMKCEGNSTLIVTVGSEEITCTKAGPTSVPGFDGILFCPDPVAYCAVADPLYCERGCLGRGTCVSGQCQCPDGWKGPDCGYRAYVDNCERCAGEEGKKQCYGDMCVPSTMDDANPSVFVLSGEE